MNKSLNSNYRPKFNDSYTDTSDILYSWCYSKMTCRRNFILPSEKLDRTWMENNIAGRMDHNVLFMTKSNPMKSSEPVKICDFKMEGYVKREVVDAWYEGTVVIQLSILYLN